MASEAERTAMRRALVLAARGAATVKPNPVVGAVVLDEHGQVAGEGWHERAGGPHAEVRALQAAGERARGASVVVTLEPCNATGRTGPCTVALLHAGVRRVVYAVDDPTPAASGGARHLRAAGVDVEGAVLADEAERVNERWLTVARLGRPHVTWKYAATLDGRVAAADGSSRWITGPQARADGHRLRALADAVLVGVGTVLTDDPHLTARSPAGALVAAQPLRVVADTEGRTPAAARVRDDAAPTWVATAGELGRGLDSRLDLAALLKELLARDVHAVLVEGGPTLAAGLLRAGLVDRVVGYVAPVLLGAGPAALGDVGAGTIDAAPRLELDDVQVFGPDVRLSARVRRGAS